MYSHHRKSQPMLSEKLRNKECISPIYLKFTPEFVEPKSKNITKLLEDISP